MDLLFEIIVEIIFEGAIEATTEKRVPMPIRILLATVLLVFFGGICGALLWVGISDKNWIILIISIILIIALISGVIYKVCKIRK